LNSIVVRQEEQASNEKLGMNITFNDFLFYFTVLRILGSKIKDIADWLVKREDEFENVTADAITFKVELRAAESRYSFRMLQMLKKSIYFNRIVDLRQKLANDAPKLQLLAAAQEESREAKAECVPRICHMRISLTREFDRNEMLKKLFSEKEDRITALEQSISMCVFIPLFNASLIRISALHINTMNTGSSLKAILPWQGPTRKKEKKKTRHC